MQLLAAQFLIDFDLDRETVTVPAGDVRGVKTCHGLRFDDEILQALVHRRAHVDRPAGVGRPVVQDVARRALARFPDALVNPHLFPELEHFRLVLGQVRLHREGGLGQVDRFLEF